MESNKDTINIGQKLRNLRKIRNISLQHLSEEIGMSYSYLSGLENEKHSISIVNLQRLSNYFGVDLIHFLDSRVTGTIVKRKDDHDNDNITEDGIAFNMVTSKDMKNLQISCISLPPNSPSDRNVHKHGKGQEMVMVTEGEVVVMVESKKHQLCEGDLIVFDSDIEHLIYTEDAGAKIMIVASPPYGRDVVLG